jgi:hypothetical protein
LHAGRGGGVINGGYEKRTGILRVIDAEAERLRVCGASRDGAGPDRVDPGQNLVP